jgi:hypothetical protein
MNLTGARLLHIFALAAILPLSVEGYRTRSVVTSPRTRTNTIGLLPSTSRSSRLKLYDKKETKVSQPSTSGIAARDALFGKIGATGVLSNLVCFYSLYVLRTTSCGLPPGFLGLEGAVEGISYLIVVGIFFWSALKKLTTGSGLWAGPFGLLGAAEGLSFLTVFGGIIVAALNLLQYGFLPGFLPNDLCFGINN